MTAVNSSIAPTLRRRGPKHKQGSDAIFLSETAEIEPSLRSFSFGARSVVPPEVPHLGINMSLDRVSQIAPSYRGRSFDENVSLAEEAIDKSKTITNVVAKHMGSPLPPKAPRVGNYTNAESSKRRKREEKKEAFLERVRVPDLAAMDERYDSMIKKRKPLDDFVPTRAIQNTYAKATRQSPEARKAIKMPKDFSLPSPAKKINDR